MKEKKHDKHIRAGNLVRLLSGTYVTDTNAIWFDRYGQRHVGRELYLATGEIGLVVEIGRGTEPVFGRPQNYCMLLIEERKLKIAGNYWGILERVKRDSE